MARDRPVEAPRAPLAPPREAATDLARTRAAARALLLANWREGVTAGGTRFAYTRPSRERYPDQFFWDSCLHAVAWSRLEPARARAELRTLVASQRPSGLIGHTAFWSGRVRPSRRHVYNVVEGADHATWTIQPPLLAWAWAEVADRSPDEPGFRREGIAPIVAFHRWLERERADADGLLGILQPDESGLDATPAYDGPLRWRGHAKPGFLAVLRFNRRRRYDYRRILADGGFHAVDVLVNTAWAMSLAGLARLGHGPAAEQAQEVTAALVRRLWDQVAGIFHAEGPDGWPLRVATWAGLAPRALDHLPEDVGQRLVERQLLDPRRFWLPYPVPSTSAAEPSFAPGRQGRIIPRYWRGPTWLFTPSFILPGLLRLGYLEEARHLVDRSLALVQRGGFREYYDPYSGQGLGARGFAVSAIVVDLAERVAAAPAAP